MKNFTEEEKFKFVTNFLLVHGIQLTPNQTSGLKVLFDKGLDGPFHVVMMPKSSVPKTIPIEDLAEVQYTLYKGLSKPEPYYLLPYLIEAAHYTGQPNQKAALDKWIATSKEFAHNYIHEKNAKDYLEKQVKIFPKLTSQAMHLWNYITMESEEYKSFDNCLNEKFWTALKQAKHYPRVTYSTPSDNCSYEEFEKYIINSFENLDDIIKFEEYILNIPIPYNIWGGSNIEIEEDVWLKVMKKLVKKGSVEKPTPLLQRNIDLLNNNVFQYNVSETKALLKPLEYCKIDCMEEFYLEIVKNSPYKSIKGYIQSLLMKKNK
jgi:hypothetical protein